MGSLETYSLRLLHLIYSLVLAVSSFYSRWSKSDPRPLDACRPKTPAHIGITLACRQDQVEDESVKEAFVLSVEKAAAWCRMVGIGRLTVYDRYGLLFSMFDVLQRRLCLLDCPSMADVPKVEMVYPPTPALFDDSDSRSSDVCLKEGANVVTVYPTSPDLHTRKKFGIDSGVKGRGLRRTSKPHSKLVVHVATQKAGKPAIASIANTLVRKLKQTVEVTTHWKDPSAFHLSVDNLQRMLEGESGLLAPDLLIVHHVTRPTRQRLPLELHAFPPWQIRLTEFYYDGSLGIRRRLLRSVLDRLSPCVVLSEVEFRRALDEYSKAEFRVGA